MTPPDMLPGGRWQRVEEIFHRALEAPPDRRSAFLEEACGEDRALRAEVESLLAHESEEGATFAGPAGDGAPISIAHYQIRGKLGEGGMGAVYRARDTKLDRDVAIKILPSDFANDLGRIARFTREAKTLAALNHPNIACIYGVEERAIVMELVEGEDLMGPLPVETALRYAAQIAEALEAAHEKGIIHRDLKPSNVRVTPEGTVKVLDFGLATSTAPPDGSRSISHTMTAGATEAGMLLGTAAYMAPEQARGEAVDRRADVWAFGAVLYEMITGKRPFGGESITDVLAAVVHREPDWSALPRSLPRNAHALLQRCLTKDRKQRLQAIGEARIALAKPDVPAAGAWLTRRIGGTVLALAILSATGVGVLVWSGTRVASQPVTRLTVQPGPEFVLSGYGPSAILSPDGARLAYTGVGPDRVRRLYTRLLSQQSVSPLPGTEGSHDPFFSPDGESLGFFAGGKLRTVSVHGTGATALCDAPLPQGGSWGEDGNIVAALTVSGVISQIASSGGSPRPLTDLRTEWAHKWPQMLPGSQAILFTSGGGVDGATIEAQSLRTGERKTIATGRYGRYVRSGHLLFVRQKVLFAAPMDIRKLELTGPPQPVVDGIGVSSYGAGQFDVTAKGTLMYQKASEGRARVQWLDRSGHTKPLRPGAAEYSESIEFSPDGKRLALVVEDGPGNADVWVYDWERDVATRLSSTAGVDNFPHWAPDGRHIVFSSVRHRGARNLHWMRADGGGDAVRITDSGNMQLAGSISADGSRVAYVAYTEFNPQTGFDLWTVQIDGADTDHPKAGTPEPLLRTPFNEDTPAISPDGRWVAYQSNENGEYELFVRRFPGAGGKWRVSVGGGTNAVWSKRRLFYVSPEGIMAIEYTAHGETFVPGTPYVWAQRKGIRVFAMAPDEKRAAIIEPDAELKPEAPHLLFVLGFFEELRRRAPGR